MNRPQPQQIYRHFKGNIYQIVCIATDSETNEEQVVYQALYGDYKYYVRPLEMFTSKVDKIKYPDVKQEYRFELVTGNNNAAKTPITETIIEKEAAAVVEQTNDAVVHIETADDSRDGEFNLDPDVLEFLDADTYERRLEILTKIKYKVTDDMIDIMSTVIDIAVPGGDVNKRYEDFREAIVTRKQYECTRFR